MTEPRHWIRPLKDGVEYGFAAHGWKLSGRVDDHEAVAELRACFEAFTGVRLPEPEVKPARGGGST